MLARRAQGANRVVPTRSSYFEHFSLKMNHLLGLESITSLYSAPFGGEINEIHGRDNQVYIGLTIYDAFWKYTTVSV